MCVNAMGINVAFSYVVVAVDNITGTGGKGRNVSDNAFSFFFF